MIIKLLKKLLSGRLKANQKDPIVTKVYELKTLANEAKNNKEWKREIELSKQILDLDESNYSAALRIINASRLLDLNIDYLIDDFTQKFPNRPEIWREKGKSLLKKDPEKSMGYWQKAWSLNETHIGTGIILLRLLKKYDKYSEALLIAQRLIQLDPENQIIVKLSSRLLIKNFQFSLIEPAVYELLKKPDIDSYFFEEYANCISTKLQSLNYEKNNDGVINSITSKERKSFIEFPKDCFKDWNASELKMNLDNYRKNSRIQKNKLRNSKKKNNILFISLNNWNFMQGIVETFDKSDCEVKTLEIIDIAKTKRLIDHEFIGKSLFNASVEEKLDYDYNEESYYIKLINWADVVYVEWCNYAAYWASVMVPPDKKLVIRLHSYEAYTHWPHLINWGNVDTLIYVAPHIKQFVNQQIKISDYGTKEEVHYNYNDLTKYNLSKHDKASKTLGMIGYNNANKNPKFGLKILTKLLKDDKSWRIRFVGSPWPSEFKNIEEENYYLDFKQFIQTNQLEQNIDYIGFTDKVYEEVRHIGFIISGSDREGTHETIIQSMGGGSIPIVRNWPLVKKWGGANNIYDEKWIVETEQEAAGLIKNINDSGTFNKVSNEVCRIALSMYDKTVVMKKIKHVIIS